MKKVPRTWLVEFRGDKRQEDVADEAGISRSSYSNIENGNRDPSVETAKKISGVLGFAWTNFFEEKRFDTKNIQSA